MPGRFRRASITTLSNGFLSAVRAVVSFVTVSMLVQYLGRESYGLCAAITGMTSWLSITQGGIGQSLKNDMIRRPESAGPLFSSAFAFLLVVVLAAGGLLSGIVPFLKWKAILNDPAFHQLPLIVISLWIVLFTALFSLVRAAYSALQSEFKLMPALLGGLLISFGLVVLGIHRAWSMTAVISVSLLANLIGLLFGLFRMPVLFSGQSTPGKFVGRPPRSAAGPPTGLASETAHSGAQGEADGGVGRRSGDRSGDLPHEDQMTLGGTACATVNQAGQAFSLSGRTVRRLYRAGLWFFVIEACTVLIFEADVFLVNLLLGSSQAAVFALHAQLFVYVQTGIVLLVSPYWAAFGDAWNAGEKLWLSTGVRRLVMSTSVLSCVGIAALFAVGRPLMNRWSHGQIEWNPVLALLIGMNVVIQGVTGVYATALGALGIAREPARIIILQAILNIAVCVWAIRRFGVVGAAFGSLATYTLTSGLYLPFKVRQVTA